MGLLEGQMTGTLGREIISTRQEKLAELARIEPKRVLTTLAHHIDEVWLREAYRQTRKDGAVGIDGVIGELVREGDDSIGGAVTQTITSSAHGYAGHFFMTVATMLLMMVIGHQ